MNTVIAAGQMSQHTIPTGTFGPRDSHRLRSFASWKDFVHDHFPWLDLRDHSTGGFEADVNAYRLSGSVLVLSTISAGASEMVRTRHLAEASEAGYVKLIWQMAGHLQIEQDGRTCRIDLGQVGVCDTARPYRIRLSEQASFAVLMLPYEAFPGWDSVSQRVCGTRLADGTTTRAAFGALMALTNLPSDMVKTEGAPVFRAVQWMLSASLLRPPGDGVEDVLHDARIHKAKRHILEHIADPGLDPDNVASALCMSRRSLYMLFKAHQMTPSKMIHDIRLEQAKHSLDDLRHGHRKISDIAFDFGYTDYATFCRLFKTRFGTTPSEFRIRRPVSLCA